MSKNIVGTIKEIYSYRYLLQSMVVRNLKGKYKKSYLGFAWHFIMPTVLIVLFYIVFTGIMDRPIENYWAYLSIGMFPFAFFQGNLIAGSGCIVSSAGTIQKMYFPREIIVLSQIISTFITFMIAYAVVIILILLVGLPVSIHAIIVLPLILLISVVFATGYVLLLSSITVFVRDVQLFIQAFSRILFWTTPIIFLASDLNRGILSEIVWYNPFTYFIESYHDILYLGVVPSLYQLGICCILATVALVVGAIVFNRLKGKFVEEL